MTDDRLGASFNAGPRVVIIGLGQEFRQDDAAGIRTIQAWLEKFPNRINDENIKVEFAGVPGLNLLFLLEDYDAAVLVDAMRSGAPPGTVNTIQISDLDAFSASGSSGHGWGAAETILLGQQVMPDKMPKQLVLIGIEAKDIDTGLGLSEQVETAIPEAATAIEVYIRNILTHLIKVD